MKAVTEFASITLTKGLTAQAALVAEGKSPEEIQQSLGASFKFEGDKLNYFMTALDVASKNSENLKRVIVARLNEGEAAPAKSTKIEDLCYIPESLIFASSKPAGEKQAGKGGRHGRGKSSGPKSSPWGLSPEEKAAKNTKKPATAPKTN